MKFFNNKKHFLHKHLSFLEAYSEEESIGGFTDLLNNLGIKTGGESWNLDHSTIDWSQIENHFQFFFNYARNEAEIRSWLVKSPLSNYKTLLTWLSFEDPIVRVKTTDFFDNWQEFNAACGWQGLILTTEDGKYFLEFTDDWKFHLNSNFEIKPCM